MMKNTNLYKEKDSVLFSH